MNGMELSERYYETYGREMIERCCGGDTEKVAAGLCGEGSQCFGYDDEISQDHDFGPGFCMWVSEEDYGRYGKKLAEAYDNLPWEFEGFTRKNIQDRGRVGVITIGEFFGRYLGQTRLPSSNREWLFLRETSLAVCTNGKVFKDDSGEFTAFRKVLLGFYPDDVLRKKVAARAAVMSQAGQYNLLRCIRRRDRVASCLALGKFTESALSMFHLLNRRYMLFYKWAYRSAKDLPKMQKAAELTAGLGKVLTEMEKDRYGEAEDMAFTITEAICAETVKELNEQGFSDGDSGFLHDHLGNIMSGIEDEEIRRLPPIYDYGF